MLSFRPILKAFNCILHEGPELIQCQIKDEQMLGYPWIFPQPPSPLLQMNEMNGNDRIAFFLICFCFVELIMLSHDTQFTVSPPLKESENQKENSLFFFERKAGKFFRHNTITYNYFFTCHSSLLSISNPWISLRIFLKISNNYSKRNVLNK